MLYNSSTAALSGHCCKSIRDWLKLRSGGPLRYLQRPRQPPKPKAPGPPMPPKPPQKPIPITIHGKTWYDPYHWMSHLEDKVAMRHMDVYMEQEEKYTEAVMYDTEKLQRKLQSEMAGRMAVELSTPPLRWGPWLYYKRVVEGKPYPVLCRRLASANDGFGWNNRASSGFDFKTGQKLEQKLQGQENKLNQWESKFNGRFEEAMDMLELARKELMVGTLANEPYFFRKL